MEKIIKLESGSIEIFTTTLNIVQNVFEWYPFKRKCQIIICW